MLIDIKENIDENVEIDSKNLLVINDVKKQSIIEAIELKIDGTTYKDSLQFARDANIHTHKGSLRCSIADIQHLKGGEVHATKVNIKTATSGSIYAKDITIDTVEDSLKIYASNSIKIRNLKGTNNILKISYSDIPIINSKLDLIEEDIYELNKNLKQISKNNITYIQIIQKELQKLEDEKNSIINSTRYATIDIKNSVMDGNNIIFKIDKKNEISFKTKNQKYNPFYISKQNNSITLHPIEKTMNI